MNKSLGYGIGAIVIIALIAAFFMMQKGTQPSSEGVVGTTQQADTQDSSAGGALKDLFTMGGSQTCTFSNKAGAQGSGTVYVSGGNVRTDFVTSIENGSTQQMHMIVKDKTSYMWGDALQGQGIKMSFADITEPTASGSQQQAGFDANQSVEYSCKPWVADASVFELPAGVQFSDLSAAIQTQVQGKMDTGVSGSSAACMQCDSVPAESRAQCKAALRCE